MSDECLMYGLYIAFIGIAKLSVLICNVSSCIHLHNHLMACPNVNLMAMFMFCVVNCNGTVLCVSSLLSDTWHIQSRPTELDKPVMHNACKF